MARSNAQLAAAVRQRAGQLRARRARRWKRALASAAVVCFVAMCTFAVLGGQGTKAGEPHPTRAQAAATELMGSPAAGGYILVGVVCFALGIALALACARWAKRRRQKDMDGPGQFLNPNGNENEHEDTK